MGILSVLRRQTNLRVIASLSCFPIASHVYAAGSDLSVLLIADVSDRSFSLAGTTEQSYQPELEWYLEISDTTPVPNPRFDFYPVASGDPFAEIRETFRDEIVQAEQAMERVKATESGLLPDTDYQVNFGIETD